MADALVSETQGQAPHQIDSPETSSTLSGSFQPLVGCLGEEDKASDFRCGPPGGNKTTLQGTKATRRPTPKQRRQKRMPYSDSYILPDGKDLAYKGARVHGIMAPTPTQTWGRREVWLCLRELHTSGSSAGRDGEEKPRLDLDSRLWPSCGIW
ncbi:Hypothetical predicted protein [Pelobates cultripes]|uniref:Uncharacterized protein n=1 Tax=Pelobates cultripes TaxID=61616 RepID=A0AAD1SJX0_PELCU|nr:Hypothetical predicted protein [Pelobates cultripes]